MKTCPGSRGTFPRSRTPAMQSGSLRQGRSWQRSAGGKGALAGVIVVGTGALLAADIGCGTLDKQAVEHRLPSPTHDGHLDHLVIDELVPGATQEDDQFDAEGLADDGLLLWGEGSRWVPGRETHGETFLASFMSVDGLGLSER